MKVVHMGNLANDAYPVVEGLRKRGVDADLYVPFPSHVCALPQWETCDLDASDIADPFNPNLTALNRDFVQPSWLHFIHIRRSGLDLPGRSVNFLRIMRRYDLIVAHVPFALYAQFSRKPYIAFDAGAIRYLDMKPSSYHRIRSWLLKRGYKNAKTILMTNPDTLDLFQAHGFNPVFMPFLIDTSRYRPTVMEDTLPFEYVFFMPSRQIWREKGNDLVVEAFARFCKEYKEALLAMIDWGEDAERTRSLVSKLGIEKSVMWLPLMSKPRVMRWYNLSTAVADQFVLGSYGTTAPEAMACEKPVVIYISEQHHLRTFGEVPPVLNARSTEEILSSLILCTDSSFRRKVGGLSREWVERHHSPEIVVSRHIAAYQGW